MAAKKTRKAAQRVEVRARRRKRRRRRALVLIAEILAIVLLAGAAFVMSKYSKFDTVTISAADIEINEGVQNEGYQTIALFGVDSRTGEIDSGTQTDTIMLACINNETKEIRLVSIYRDTLCRMDDGALKKANSAYATGGPADAISMLNRNLDLDITDYVTVDFAAMADCIDLLGGVEITVTDAEAEQLNKYVDETASVAGKEARHLTGGGTYNLDGSQAVTYARLRKGLGDDYSRTERQRLVLTKMFEKVRTASLGTINDILDAVLPQISTNITFSQMLRLAGGISSYQLGDSCGFPYVVEDQVKYNGSSVVIPVDLTENVAELHSFLYDEPAYSPSWTVQEISEQIIMSTGVDPADYESELAEAFGTGSEENERP